MTKIQQLRAFLRNFKASDLRVDGAFQQIIMEGMDLLELADDDCARLFDVSRSTVTRWRNGSTAPHRAMRLPLCKILEKVALRRLKMLERRERHHHMRSRQKPSVPLKKHAFA